MIESPYIISAILWVRNILRHSWETGTTYGLPQVHRSSVPKDNQQRFVPLWLVPLVVISGQFYSRLKPGWTALDIAVCIFTAVLETKFRAFHHQTISPTPDTSFVFMMSGPFGLTQGEGMSEFGPSDGVFPFLFLCFFLPSPGLGRARLHL